MTHRWFTFLRHSCLAVLTVVVLITGACGAGGTQGPTVPALAIQLNSPSAVTLKQVQLRATIVCGPWLVLAPHATTYSQSELAAIGKFVQQNIPGPGDTPFPDGDVAYTGYNVATPAVLPPTLTYVPGAKSCDGSFEITNTGNSEIQVNSLSFQLTQPASPFTYDYHVLDACPYMRSCVCTGCGAFIPCVYRADFQMTLKQSLTTAKLTASDPFNCPLPITLAPGGTTPIFATFDRPKETGGYWFRGDPEINVTSAQGTSTLSYSSMPNNLNFVNLVDHPAQRVDTPFGPGLGTDNDIPGMCYTQKGDAFVPISSFTAVGDPYQNIPGYSPYCV